MAIGGIPVNAYTDIPSFMNFVQDTGKRLLWDGNREGVQQFLQDLVNLDAELQRYINQVPTMWTNYRHMSADIEAKKDAMQKMQAELEELQRQRKNQYGAYEVESDTDEDTPTFDDDDDVQDEDDYPTINDNDTSSDDIDIDTEAKRIDDDMFDDIPSSTSRRRAQSEKRRQHEHQTYTDGDDSDIDVNNMISDGNYGVRDGHDAPDSEDYGFDDMFDFGNGNPDRDGSYDNSYDDDYLDDDSTGNADDDWLDDDGGRYGDDTGISVDIEPDYETDDAADDNRNAYGSVTPRTGGYGDMYDNSPNIPGNGNMFDDAFQDDIGDDALTRQLSGIQSAHQNLNIPEPPSKRLTRREQPDSMSRAPMVEDDEENITQTSGGFAEDFSIDDDDDGDIDLVIDDDDDLDDFFG